MKNLLKFLSIFALVGALFSIGCDPEPPEPPVIDPPTLEFVGYDGNTTISDQAVDDFITYTVKATKGTGNLTQISVYEDDVLLDPSRIKYDAGTGYFSPDGNPTALAGDEQSGFEWKVAVNPQDELGTKTFKITIADDEVESASVTFDVTVEVSTTALDSTLVGVLFNRAGPTGTGGLNLLTGEGTGSSDPASHIRDEGIDGTLPLDQNWKQQISGINNSVLKTPAETIDFDAVDNKEAIADAFAAGTEFIVSEKITGGEIFIIQNGDHIFLVRIDAVNVITDSNGDNYEMSIKY